MEKKQGIGFFERYLTIWVALCIVIGMAIGQYLPAIPQTLSKFEYANVSIPVAILIWLMIYPMMLKVDFQSIKNVGKRPKGIIITCITNWLIKPFTMFGIAYLFFYVVFKSLISAELAEEYLAGAVLLGAAPCTAMVFVWSYLTKGDAAYTLVQVAVNDLIILVAFAPIVAFLLDVGGVTIPWDTLLLSVVLFVVIPLSAGIMTRILVIRRKGIEYFNTVFIRKFDNYTIGVTINTYHSVLISRRNHIEQSVAHCIDCRSACVANSSDILCSLWLGEVVEIASQYSCTCRNDWCKQFF